MLSQARPNQSYQLDRLSSAKRTTTQHTNVYLFELSCAPSLPLYLHNQTLCNGGKSQKCPFFSLAYLFISIPCFCSPLQYQTLVIKPLTSVPTFSWPEFKTLTTTQPGSDNGSATSLTAPLLPIDALISSNRTTEQILSFRLRRDSLRVKALTSRVASDGNPHGFTGEAAKALGAGGFSNSVISGLGHGSGEYFTRLGVGTPPTIVYMVLDTGSDLVWLQCAPCVKCYKQSDSIFHPTKSRTFVGVSCPCPGGFITTCNGHGMCTYEQNYGDNSFTTGDLSRDTLVFGGMRFDNLVLGCGHDNRGLFSTAAGLLGFGRGELSFPSQTKSWFNGKFSYCLADRESKAISSIVFGDGAVPDNAVFTPTLTNPNPINSYYYVELLGISIGGTRVSGVDASLFKIDDGGVIVDSGTTITRLTRPAYVAVRDAFRSGSAGLKFVDAPKNWELFDTCFDLSGKTEAKIPTVTLHFREADVALPAENCLIRVNKGISCFAFAATKGESKLSIIGNVQQQGFRVVYDLIGSRIGFAPNGCP